MEEKIIWKRKSAVSNNNIKKKVKKEEAVQPEAPLRSVEFKFIGDPIPMDEAVKRWPERYVPEVIEKIKQENARMIARGAKDNELEEIMDVKCHYSKALVDGTYYDLNDNAHVLGDKPLPYVCKIIEFFETIDNEAYFRAQWYYRPTDTVCREAVLKKKNDKNKSKEEQEQDVEDQYQEEQDVEDPPQEEQDVADKKDKKNKAKNKPKIDHKVHLHEKRIFISKVKDNNPLDLLLEKVNIARIASNVDSKMKQETIANSDYFYDMAYQLPYKSFVSIPPEDAEEVSGESSGISTASDSENSVAEIKKSKASSNEFGQSSKSELSLLDLYSGCGAMSTGLTLGADVGGLKLVTRWAVDCNASACQTLELNHPKTMVRNECAEDFLSLLKEWRKLCNQYLPRGCSNDTVQGSEDPEDLEELSPGEFVVESLVGISFGKPEVNAANFHEKDEEKKVKATELFFKVHWKGYASTEDTWESYKGLSNCEDKICEFVKKGHHSKLLPLPGDVDVICGGPPCQGISGFNRFRNDEEPLDDNKNYQMLVYMDIVKFLNPPYILMENVVDLVKFADGYLARYAVKRLLSMDYQVRLGIMAAGSFGLPQFRQRVFVWGAHIDKKIPSYPYPTHEVVVRGGIPTEFEQCLVAYDEDNKPKLEDRLFLKDALTDLPEVHNGEERDEMPYGENPLTDFQRYIRMNREGTGLQGILFDHNPLVLNTDDYQRVCRVPKQKGANFSHMGGVFLNAKGKWEIDSSKPREMLASKKPLIPEYALTFTGGNSSKPFARLWWDETVPTVVTRAEPHNQAIMHPVQDRVLSVRENARLQGFPDYYKFCGTIKEKYVQIGNAVAVPVGKVLGYALALAWKGNRHDEPLFKLPENFALIVGPLPTAAVETENRAVQEE
ncbi:hypothetical protein MKX01_009591 [Papaver californicum]|nr:hypothetical protein MKX01_009591 [Papaver californicum]